jgi:hypothetical protein
MYSLALGAFALAVAGCGGKKEETTETAPAPAAGAPDGADDASDGGCSVVHDDGFGGHWTDCQPLGTYTFAQATVACATHTGDAKYCADLGAGNDTVCSSQDSYPVCACWAYAGALDPGFVNHGQYGCHPPGGGLGTDTAWH